MMSKKTPSCTSACSYLSISTLEILALLPHLTAACQTAYCKRCRTISSLALFLRMGQLLRIVYSFLNFQGIRLLEQGNHPQTLWPQGFVAIHSLARGRASLTLYWKDELISCSHVYNKHYYIRFYSLESTGKSLRVSNPVSKPPYNKAEGPPCSRLDPEGPP